MELKPCPFCGGTAVISSEWAMGQLCAYNVYFAVCTRCGCRTGFYDKRPSAAEAWNRRDPDKELIEMAVKKKRMTQRQKDERAQVKKELQAKGVLPPDKPRLNRKKFAKEVWAEYEAMDTFRREIFLLKAIGCMVGPDMLEVTPEEVGVLKMLKLAVEMDKFSQQLEAEGRDTYTLGEISEKVIMPILKL